MKVCGIIAEYNPFHSGHAYQIRKAREQSGCDYVIVALSGDFVQRGAPALTDKYTRAREALLEGADLVLMLPVYGSTASAEGFARAGVSALLTTGVVNAISFGCEDPAICGEPYVQLAKAFAHESADFRAALADRLSRGIPYAKARVEAIRSCYGNDFAFSLFDTPNNLLAFEYMRALAVFGAELQIVPIRRLGSYHDVEGSASDAVPTADPGHSSVPSDGTFASASACRKLLLSDLKDPLQRLEHTQQIPGSVCRLLADYAHDYDFLQEDDLSQMLHYALLSQKNSGYEQYLDCGSDLSARICNSLDAYKCVSQFCDLLKNKSVTRARIARTLAHILLQLPSQMPAPLVSNAGVLPYLRVLGFRQTAAPLLHEIKQCAQTPLITRVPEAGQMLSEETMLYFKQDLLASDIYRSALFHKCGRCYADDYRRKIEIV